MKQFWLQIAALLIVIFGALALYANPAILNNSFDSILQKQQGVAPVVAPTPKKLNITDPDGKTKTVVIVDIADTQQIRAKGLSGRESLPAEQGMLFIFDKSGKYNFWMKSVKFPLDFIWIGGDKVVDILPNIPIPGINDPDSALPIYTAVAEFDKVLEVNAGFVSAYKIQIGDKIKFVE